MRESFVRSGLMRVLVAALLWLLAAGVAGPRIPLPAQPPQRAGAQALSAQLAVSAWTRADLDAWWAGLRAMDGSPGRFIDKLPARLQPPADPSAWREVALPDVRPREPGRDLDDEPQYQMRWYRLRYAPPEGRWPTSVALYMPRLVTMAAAVLVHTEEGWRPVFDNQSGARGQRGGPP